MSEQIKRWEAILVGGEIPFIAIDAKDHDAAIALKDARIAELETLLGDAECMMMQVIKPPSSAFTYIIEQIGKAIYGREVAASHTNPKGCTRPGCFPHCDCGSADDYVPATPSEDGREVIGYTTPGMLKIARELNGEGRIGVRGKRDERFSVPVYTSAQSEDWGAFIGYLIDKCEGHEVTEENLQGWMCEMLADPHYGALFRREKQPHASVPEIAQPARQVVDEREQFEAFYAEKAKTLPLALGNSPVRYAGGQYVNDFALFGWMVWSARAALAPNTVVMPDHKTCDDAPWMSADTEPDIAWRDGYNAAIDEAKSIPASLLRLIVSGNECAREIDKLRALLGKEGEE